MMSITHSHPISAVGRSIVDQDNPLVIGAAGCGKTLWANMLLRDDTRATLAQAYPRLQLHRTITRAGIDDEVIEAFDNIDLSKDVSENLIDMETIWNNQITRLLVAALGNKTLKDHADISEKLRGFDMQLGREDKIFLIIFDNVHRLTFGDEYLLMLILTALVRAICRLDGHYNIRAKIFARPADLDGVTLCKLSETKAVYF